LAQWYRARTENARGARKPMIVALARKLLIALWRFGWEGGVPDGGVLCPGPLFGGGEGTPTVFGPVGSLGRGAGCAAKNAGPGAGVGVGVGMDSEEFFETRPTARASSARIEPVSQNRRKALFKSRFMTDSHDRGVSESGFPE